MSVSLDALLHALQGEGFQIGVDDHLRLGRLLANFSGDHDAWRFAVRSLLARTPNAIETFDAVFARVGGPWPTPTSTEDHATVRSPPRSATRRRVVPWALLLILAALATAWLLARVDRPTTFGRSPDAGSEGETPVVISLDAGRARAYDASVSRDVEVVDSGPIDAVAPVEARPHLLESPTRLSKSLTVDQRRDLEDGFPAAPTLPRSVRWAGLVALVSALVGAGSWIARRRGMRALQRGPWHLVLRVPEELGVPSWPKRTVYAVADALALIPTGTTEEELDVDATIDATVATGGYLAPRYVQRAGVPSVAFVLDNSSASRAWRTLFEDLSRRVGRAGIEVERWTSQAHEPRLRDEEGRPAAGGERTLLEGVDRVVVFGDDANRTAQSSDRSGRNVETRVLRLFPNRPATEAPTDAVIAWMRGERPRARPIGAARPPARLLALDTPPSESLEQVRNFVGAEAWRVLQVASLAPVPHPGVIDWLVDALQLPYPESGRLKVLSLPWFAEGRWPTGWASAALASLRADEPAFAARAGDAWTRLFARMVPASDGHARALWSAHARSAGTGATDVLENPGGRRLRMLAWVAGGLTVCALMLVTVSAWRWRQERRAWEQLVAMPRPIVGGMPIAVLEAACWAGEPRPCVALGIRVETGLGITRPEVPVGETPTSESLARRWYQRACDLGSGRGCWRVGVLMERALNRDPAAEPSPVAAITSMYDEACRKGERPACLGRGFIVDDQRCPASTAFVASESFLQGSPFGPGDEERFRNSGPLSAGARDEHPQRQVTLSSYCIDRREVSVREYRACVEAGACRPAHQMPWRQEGGELLPPLSGHMCNDRAAGGELDGHPVNCTDWSMAVDYCRWRGARLPTEAEWELAAGSGDGFPWGSVAVGPGLLNVCGTECAEGVGEYEENVPTMYSESDGYPGTAPVGSFPAGASSNGLLDLSGNVAEWTSDWYFPRYASEPAINPLGPASGTARVTRGGSWRSYDATTVRVRARASESPAVRSDRVGFRCVIGSIPGAAHANLTSAGSAEVVEPEQRDGGTDAMATEPSDAGSRDDVVLPPAGNGVPFAEDLRSLEARLGRIIRTCEPDASPADIVGSFALEGTGHIVNSSISIRYRNGPRYMQDECIRISMYGLSVRPFGGPLYWTNLTPYMSRLSLHHGDNLQGRPVADPTVRVGTTPRISGLVPEESIEVVVERNMGQVNHCIEQGRATSPELQGRVMIRFVIGGTGTVIGSSVLESSIPVPSVGECIANAVRRWPFPVPAGGGVITVNYPFQIAAGEAPRPGFDPLNRDCQRRCGSDSNCLASCLIEPDAGRP